MIGREWRNESGSCGWVGWVVRGSSLVFVGVEWKM